MMHSYHAAARSGSAAVPTVDRSASDSVTHKTQLKQIQKKYAKTHRRTTQLAVGVNDTPAHGRFVR